jgi:Transposase C of IS166 homeodomain
MSADQLPNDVNILKLMLMAENMLVDKLKLQIAVVRRMKFGQSSEQLDLQIEQLELIVDEIQMQHGEHTAFAPQEPLEESSTTYYKPRARPLLKRHWRESLRSMALRNPFEVNPKKNENRLEKANQHRY